MDHDDPEDDGFARTLTRIADILDVPVSAFVECEPQEADFDPSADPRAAQFRQLLVLVRLFNRIESPAARARCIDYMRRQDAHLGPNPCP